MKFLQTVQKQLNINFIQRPVDGCDYVENRLVVRTFFRLKNYAILAVDCKKLVRISLNKFCCACRENENPQCSHFQPMPMLAKM